MKYLGDFVEDATVRFLWPTNDGNGGSITRATDGTIKVRRASTGADVTGTSVTDNEDTPAVGIHECKVDTSDGAGYVTGEDYEVWLDGAVINGQTVNTVLAHFSIENRTVSALNNLSSAQAATAAAAALAAARLDLVADVAGRVELSGTGLDQIPTTEPAGLASTFREMIVRLYWRSFGKVVFRKTAAGTGTVDFYNAAETKVAEAAWTSSDTQETQGKAAEV